MQPCLLGLNAKRFWRVLRASTVSGPA